MTRMKFIQFIKIYYPTMSIGSNMMTLDEIEEAYERWRFYTSNERLPEIEEEQLWDVPRN